MKEKVFIVVQYFYRWDETRCNVFDTKEGVREFVSEVYKKFKEHPEEFGFNDDINEVKDDCKKLGRWKKTNYSIDIFDDCNGFHLYTVDCEMNNKDLFN